MPFLEVNDGGTIKRVTQPFINIGGVYTKAKKVFHKHATLGWVQHWPAQTVIRVPAGTNRSLAQLALAAHADPTVAVVFDLHSGDIVGSTSGSPALITGDLSIYPEATFNNHGEVQAGTGEAFKATSNLIVNNSGAIRAHGGNGGHGGKGANKNITNTVHVGSGNHRYTSNAVWHFHGLTITVSNNRWKFDYPSSLSLTYTNGNNVTTMPTSGTWLNIPGSGYMTQIRIGSVLIIFSTALTKVSMSWHPGTLVETITTVGGNGGTGGTGQRYNHAKTNGNGGALSNPHGGNTGGKGGNGGTWGANGTNGVNGGGGGTSGRTNGTAAGKAVTGNANVTWGAVGTINGARV